MRPDCCRWLERVNACFDGEGSPWERWRCRRHTRRCGTCRRWLRQAEAGWRLLRGELDAPDSSPPGFIDRVMQGVYLCPGPAASAAPACRLVARPAAAGPWLAAGAVAALCAVLVPVSMRDREEALSATCQDNLRQISTALRVYADDHDDRLPPANDWDAAVRLYSRGASLSHCPSDPAPTSLPSYSFVESLGTAPLASLPGGSNTPLVYDGRAGIFARRHCPEGTPRGNVGFADGHVQPLAQLSLW